jgi:hypothetical protein
MYAICSTKKGDVKKCVKKMNDIPCAYDLYQFGQTIYKKLEENQNGVPEAIRGRKITHLITIMTGQIHKKTCKKAVGCSDTINASITRLALTGLKKCSCMK